MSALHTRKHRVAHHPFSRTTGTLDEALTAQALIDARNKAAAASAPSMDEAVSLVESVLGGVVVASEAAPLVNALMVDGFYPDDRLSDLSGQPYTGLFAEEYDQA